ncbi:MAG: hypothetical protein KF752_17830 [Pirellulaceae bacterium]|nr:hypothetical protein [Pirellulaceae bacterium]
MEDREGFGMRQYKRQQATLKYPKHWLRPEDLLNFEESPAFIRRWGQLGLDVERDLFALQIAICVDPKFAPVIPGTDGIRKGRFVPPGRNVGKSGGYRVLYVYFEGYGFVHFLLVYSKSEIEDISEGVKRQLNKLVIEAGRELRRRWPLRLN